MLSYPARAPRAAVLAFAREREDWLRRALAGIPQAQQVEAGTALPFEGQPLRLVAAPLRRARMEGGTLLVPPGRAGGPAAEAFLRAAARARLEPLCRDHAALLGREPGRITLRDTRSRWGSCTARGDLMFSWRLVLAPPEVLDYVAAHEVAHLVELNHSARFWSLVEQLVPGWKGQRNWLRQKGAALHRYRFRHD